MKLILVLFSLLFLPVIVHAQSKFLTEYESGIQTTVGYQSAEYSDLKTIGFGIGLSGVADFGFEYAKSEYLTLYAPSLTILFGKQNSKSPLHLGLTGKYEFGNTKPNSFNIHIENAFTYGAFVEAEIKPDTLSSTAFFPSFGLYQTRYGGNYGTTLTSFGFEFSIYSGKHTFFGLTGGYYISDDVSSLVVSFSLGHKFTKKHEIISIEE